MTEEELGDLLRSTPILDVVVDTNALLRGRHRRLGSVVERYGRRTGRTLRLVVPTLVHAEVSFRNRRQHGVGFDESLTATLLEAFLAAGGVLEAFDQEAAERHGRVLVRRFPTDTAWDGGKRRVAESTQVVGGRGATVDWFIASQAVGRVLLSDDAGVEMQWLEHVVTYRTLSRTLDEMIANADENNN